MKKNVLMVATVPSMIGQFNMNNIHILLDMGYQVDVAADFSDTSVWPKERVEQFEEQLKQLGIECFQLDFSRNPLKIGRHYRSYKESVNLIKKRNYAFIHTHTPVASAIIRQAARKTKTKVIYTAHGFHFYKGAPLKNWLIFYPIEKYYSRYTDVLITINKEDYKRALQRFEAKSTYYIPGVGVDTFKYSHNDNGSLIREELFIPDDRIMLLSVGELNSNKNHESVIKAIKGLNITYVIVGKGELKEKLEHVAKEYDVDLRLVGFKENVVDYYSAADIYILPSYREGLNVSLMEAMACGLPVVCSRIRGNIDLISENDCLFSPRIEEEIRHSIIKVAKNKEHFSNINQEAVGKISTQIVGVEMYRIYHLF